MYKKLLMAMILSCSTVQMVQSANILTEIGLALIDSGKATYSVAADSASFLKKNTWDAPIGKCQHGGKILIVAGATVLLVDKVYCYWVNRKILRQYYGLDKPKAVSNQAKSASADVKKG